MRRKELWQKFPAGQDTGHKQYKYLYRQMLDEGIVRKAYKKLRKGKTKRKEIIYIDAHLDKEVPWFLALAGLTVQTLTAVMKNISSRLSFLGNSKKLYQNCKGGRTNMKDWTQERCSERPDELQVIAPGLFMQRRNIQKVEHEADETAGLEAYTEYVCESREITEGEYAMLGSIEQINTDKAIDEYTLRLMEEGVL